MLTSLTLPMRLFMMMLIAMMVGGEYHDSFRILMRTGSKLMLTMVLTAAVVSRFSHRER